MSLHANSTVVAASPSAATETVIGLVSGTDFTANEPAATGIHVRYAVNITLGTTGSTVTYKIRQGGLTGTTVFTSAAIPFLTGVLTQVHDVEVVDTSALATSSNPVTYVLTVNTSAGTTTVNSITSSANAASAAQ